jgi:hypothetical protein
MCDVPEGWSGRGLVGSPRATSRRRRPRLAPVALVCSALALLVVACGSSAGVRELTSDPLADKGLLGWTLVAEREPATPGALEKDPAPVVVRWFRTGGEPGADVAAVMTYAAGHGWTPSGTVGADGEAVAHRPGDAGELRLVVRPDDAAPGAAGTPTIRVSLSYR